jgi:hypothetical protein
MLLSVIRNDLGLPEEFFVPDLWDTSTKLSESERREMRDVWTLGHDLAAALGYKQCSYDDLRNGVGGSAYKLPNPS